ncbi:MAG TPA: hypothetical protein PLB16_11950 [bacterium]|nr:hypothetical protein [bacterium]
MAGSNIFKIEIVAKGFGDLVKDIVFIGGAVTELYADSAVPEEIRATEDVDVVVKIVSRIEFNKFEESLRQLGFKNDVSEGAPICRWICNGIKVDVMPMISSVLGFGNIWYESGFNKREKRSLGNGIEIFVFPLMIYMAAKMEAVKDRGSADLRFSQDFEDIVYLFDNCDRIKEFFDQADEDVRIYLSKEFSSLEKMTVFKEAVMYAMPYGSQDERIREILESVNYIIKHGNN